MKSFPFYVATAIAAFGLTAVLHSQAPAAPKTPLQQAQAIKLQNQQLLESQTAVLIKLDELQKEAAQIRFLTKRG